MIIITETEYNLSNSKIDLTRQEWEKLLENAELFKKFLMKAKFNYQISLTTGKFIDREKECYRWMSVCDELVKDLDSIEQWFIAWNKKQEEEKKEENN